MPVNSVHPRYGELATKWERCRDCFDGEDAVKAKGTKYLPVLDAHRSGSARAAQDYQDYIARAVFYGAFKRTVQGLNGAIFQKPLQADIPAWIKGQELDVALTGRSLEAFAVELAREELITGTYGVLVDMPTATVPGARPYWALYRAEAIVNWRTDAQRKLTLVVLAENVLLAKDDDAFEQVSVQQYRELGLDEVGNYYQRVWRQDPGDKQEFVAGPFEYPQRNGKPLTFIPFVFDTEIDTPPLDDLAIVNLSHYRNSADLEHGLHYVGVPQLVISPPPESDGKPLAFGPRSAIGLPIGGKAEILQADGAMLGALFTADERKRALMASLGARLLESPSGAAETATAVGMRHSGEQASLASIARDLSRDLTRALRIHAWWASRTADAPDQVSEARVELNMSFFALKATPEEIRAAMELLQEERISYETFYARLSSGGWARDGVGVEQELEAIDKSRAARANASARSALDDVLASDASAGAPPAPGGQTIADLFLNGAQIKAASDIVAAVAKGEIPRDAGLGQLRVLLRLDEPDAEAVMGSAGTGEPTTPNPNPAEQAAA